MSADAVEIVVSILVSVNRPVTREGLMSSVVPLPLPVEMLAVNEPSVVPPFSVPPAPIVQDALVPLALKLPFDWANDDAAKRTAVATIVTNFVILSSFSCFN